MKVLSKGADVPFVHQSIGWGDATNFKDYDIVFVNLGGLEETSDQYDHPYNESDWVPKLMDSSDVSEFIRTGGYMIVYLPNSLVVHMGDTTTKKKSTSALRQVPAGSAGSQQSSPDPYNEYEVLDWLPFSIEIDTDESGKSVEVLDESWAWYFGDEFSWDKLLSGTTSSTGYDIEELATNSYAKNISVKVYSSYGEDGYVALLPSSDEVSYSDFVAYTLKEVFGLDITVEGRSPPSWLSDYRLPGEENIESQIAKRKEEIAELESELDSQTTYKKLLYETDTQLEEVTKRTLREFGFTVEDGIPGKRDGILETNSTDFALEITGTTGGIKLSKCRQLDEWVENLTVESPGGDISGLLIVNPEMSTPPDERQIELEPNVGDYMKRRGDYKILTTLDLYNMVEIDLNVGLSRDDLEPAFDTDDVLLKPLEYVDE